ncbi:hypothetical protein ABZV61_11060 [Streptomyces sp900116325]|uniref:Gram-positive cocci surface proteins LPxTG domain-containing protein n=1 Tax=Streptomyces sp. 900116325 TaxID=3154295 RepID=A0ABV2U657_9ACTN
MTTSPKWRVALASAASAAVLVAAPLVGMQAAYAQQNQPPYPPPPSCLTLSTTTVHAGDRVRFRSTCFAARQLVTAELHSHEVVLGRFRANSQGVVSGRVTIPWRTEPGRHTFELEGRHPNRKYSTRIRVRDDDRRPGRSEPGGRAGLGTNATSGGPGHRDSHQQLAATGSEKKALTLGGTAAGLVAAGGGTLMAVRRRRSS